MNASLENADVVEVAAAESKMYDLSMVEAISGGDQSFILKMLQLFLDTVPVSLREMRTLTDKRQWPELSKVAHKLKSTIDSVGIAELKQPIRDVELNGKSGSNVEAIPAQVKTIIEVMNKVMAKIKADHSL